MQIFNEDSRVKIPTILHLISLGYEYLSLKDENIKIDESSNIFLNIFYSSIKKINHNVSDSDIDKLFSEILIELDNQDLGRSFYKRLVNQSGTKLVDFDNFHNNTFNVVTELTYKCEGEEFRPDITLLINGIPLMFVEVKKPNNKEGILAEQKRIITRFQNKKFRKFINITQLMVFSNNMEYDDESTLKIQGSFYATTSYKEPTFNYFREEDKRLGINIVEVEDDIENFVLRDNNLVSIKNSPEFSTNKNPNSPINNFCTSLFHKDRISFLLQYGFAYVKDKNGWQKHVMRYPQIFATKAIEERIKSDKKEGIIWHTQGSGKTALAFFNVKYLTDLFTKKNIIPKFYFIVDRLDLLDQASKEFRARDLVVHNINSKEEFINDMAINTVINNDSGKPEITVVNIQRFADDPSVIKNNDYNINIQRIFFLDEVHRSYNPKGSFLANLATADSHSIKIGLTGTPLLGDKYSSTSLFGSYIHKYYYNASIKDGYTLRLIREKIETQVMKNLKEVINNILIKRGAIDKRELYARPEYVEPMLDYILADFSKTRISSGDSSIGAMVICDSSDQAKTMYEIFLDKLKHQSNDEISKNNYRSQKKINNKITKAALILHDIGSKDERKNQIEKFKDGEIDILFVYGMLQTGFDAERLKKIYLGRVIKAHNLLQTLTRVNRPYKKFSYGYVVDFADIEKEFEKTNADYFRELKNEFGSEIESYSNLFKSDDEIKTEIENIKNVLFKFDIENPERFSQQINDIQSRSEILKISNVLNQAQDLYNSLRLNEKDEDIKKLNFRKLNILRREANNRLSIINMKHALEERSDNSNLLNIALEDVYFVFKKVTEEEMILADELKDAIKKTRESLRTNFDHQDPKFISLKDELERLFQKKNLNEITKIEMEKNIKDLTKIFEKSSALDQKNTLLKEKYNNDIKFVRLHKRLEEQNFFNHSESNLYKILFELKKSIDNLILKNINILDNENYVKRMIGSLIIEEFSKDDKVLITSSTINFVNDILVREYVTEYNGQAA